MDINMLQAIGCFAPRGLKKKTVEFSYPEPLPAEQWEDPAVPQYGEDPQMLSGTLDVWVRPQSSAEYLEMLGAERNSRTDLMLVRCLCDQAGQPLFTAEQVVSLKQWLYIPLLVAVNEANRSSEKKTTPTMNGGATSRSRSAAKPSRSGRKSSR